MKENFSKLNFQQLCKAKGLSQSEIAGLTGYDRSYINNLQAGKVMPSIYALEHLAWAIGCSSCTLLKCLVFNTLPAGRVSGWSSDHSAKRESWDRKQAGKYPGFRLFPLMDGNEYRRVRDTFRERTGGSGRQPR